MTPKPVEWAKVVEEDMGASVDLLGQRVICGAWKADARHIANRLNYVLSPLLARSALLDRAVEAIRAIAYHRKGKCRHPEKYDSYGVNQEMAACYEECMRSLEEILTSYASLPKMPEEKQ